MSLQLIGMAHLGPLPGSPQFHPPFSETVNRAVADALTLQEAGFDAVFLENYGDIPFFADDVPDVTVAAMARAVTAVRDRVSLPIGVNVLRNDALAAMAVAAACDASLIRVNVLSGSMYTDQGLIQGQAAQLLRLRRALGVEVEILADLFVKHAVPPAGLEIVEAAADLLHRGMADGLVISGSATGHPIDLELLDQVRQAHPQARLLAGSGVTAHTVGSLAGRANGVIVGTNLKVDGQTTNPVDPHRANAFVQAARAV